MCVGFIAVTKKGQDLTRPGEKDDLMEIFHKQREEYRAAARAGHQGSQGEGCRRAREGQGRTLATGPCRATTYTSAIPAV